MAAKRLARPVAFAIAIAGSAAAANAAEVVFAGSMSGTSTSVLAPGCAPLPRLSTLTGPGSSSFGNFGYRHDVCLQGAGPIRGSFFFDFSGGNTFQGTVMGAATANPTPALFDLVLDYVIDAGAGQFAGASGSFRGTGLVDQRNLPTIRASINFAAVPEPATWASLLLGFGIVGGALRRARRKRQGGANASSRSPGTAIAR